MPDFVSSPANFCHLLPYFVGYLDAFPNLIPPTAGKVAFCDLSCTFQKQLTNISLQAFVFLLQEMLTSYYEENWMKSPLKWSGVVTLLEKKNVYKYPFEAIDDVSLKIY